MTVTNSSNAAYTITQAAVSGTGFDMKAPSLPMTLAAGQSTTFTTIFAPAAIGNTSGTVLITKTQLTLPRENGVVVQAAPLVTTQQATIALVGAGVSVTPSITTQPASQAVTAGQAATFLVAAQAGHRSPISGRKTERRSAARHLPATPHQPRPLLTAVLSSAWS